MTSLYQFLLQKIILLISTIDIYKLIAIINSLLIYQWYFRNTHPRISEGTDNLRKILSDIK